MERRELLKLLGEVVLGVLPTIVPFTAWFAFDVDSVPMLLGLALGTAVITAFGSALVRRVIGSRARG